MLPCPFCEIAKGRRSAVILYRTDRVTAFLDHRPLGTGHTLVISNAHYSDIFDVDPQTLAEAVAVAKRVASTINSTFRPLGINIIQNNGYHAGQTIFHFHIHIIPRYDESYSNLLSKIAEGRRVVDASILEEVGRRMQKSL